MKEITDAPGTGQLAPEHQQATSRRRLLKVMGVSALTIAAGNIIPDRWSAPLLRFGAVPVHAQTSGEHEDPPAPQGCPHEVLLEVVVEDEHPRDGDTLISGEGPGDPPVFATTQVRYRARVTGSPPIGSTVSFRFADTGVEFGSADTTDAGGEVQLPTTRDLGDPFISGQGTQRVYAEYDCARSRTWTYTWGLN